MVGVICKSGSEAAIVELLSMTPPLCCETGGKHKLNPPCSEIGCSACSQHHWVENPWQVDDSNLIPADLGFMEWSLSGIRTIGHDFINIPSYAMVRSSR